jgi:hypothetical protein
MTSQSAVLLPDGSRSEHAYTNEMRVTELVEGPLDPDLFAVPPGFRQVEHIDRNPSPTPSERWSVTWESFKSTVARFFEQRMQFM